MPMPIVYSTSDKELFVVTGAYIPQHKMYTLVSFL